MDQSPHKCIEQERVYTQGWWTRWKVASYAPPPANEDISIRTAWYDGWMDADRRIRADLIRTLARPMIDPRPAASGE